VSFLRKFFFITVTCAFILTANIAFAHPGRTDSKGGHTCRTNCTERWGLKYGEYHYHGIKTKTAKIVGNTVAKQKAKIIANEQVGE